MGSVACCTCIHGLVSARQTGQCYLWQAHGCAGTRPTVSGGPIHHVYRWSRIHTRYTHKQALKASTARRGSYLVVRAADDKVVVIGLAADSGTCV